MLGFLFGWLGSLVFFAGYFAVTLFIGTMFLRWIAPNTFRFITTGVKNYLDDTFGLILLATIIYTFWPLILIGVLVKFAFKITFSRIIGPTLRKSIKFADSVTPSVEFKVKD